MYKYPSRRFAIKMILWCDSKICFILNSLNPWHCSVVSLSQTI